MATAPVHRKKFRGFGVGDDIAIECLATEFKREVFVVKSML